MTARPILFSGPMVRELLEGRKTQTRRVMKFNAAGRAQYSGHQWHPDDPNVVKACPYGQPGDLLWVRETWCGKVNPESGIVEYNGDGNTYPIWYRADGDEIVAVDDDGCVAFNKDGSEKSPWKPSIHMPRWASRLTLKVTDVRVQRLQDISQEDTVAEGMPAETNGFLHHTIADYRRLWGQLHGPDSWDANPWCWCLTFEVIQKNVDAVGNGDG